jgi:hypothetical protein
LIETMQGQSVGGGGGSSTFFAHPSWQTGPGTNSRNGREQPDIALLAGLQPGIGINVSSQGGFVGIGNGTSAAAPLAAGIFALIADHGGSNCKLGLPNSTLYQLGAAQAQGGAAVFHDITTGDISANGTQGPAAGPGYDEATGWGSIDVTMMVNTYPACGVTPTTGSTSSTSGTTGSTASAGPTGSTTGGTNSTGASNAGGTSGSTGLTHGIGSGSGSGSGNGSGTSGSVGVTSGGSGTTGAVSVPAGDTCSPCHSGSDCPNSGEQCVSEGGASGFCSPACTDDSQCGAGNLCTSMVDGQGNQIFGCYPATQTCQVGGGSSGGTSAGASSGNGGGSALAGGTPPRLVNRGTNKGGCASAPGLELLALLASLSLRRSRRGA